MAPIFLCDDSDAQMLTGVADEGGATKLSGGIHWLTLPAGYLGSSLIGAALIACGFDTNASKVACIVLGAFFICTLWWARRNLLCVCFSPWRARISGSCGMMIKVAVLIVVASLGRWSFCWECQV